MTTPTTYLKNYRKVITFYLKGLQTYVFSLSNILDYIYQVFTKKSPLNSDIQFLEWALWLYQLYEEFSKGHSILLERVTDFSKAFNFSLSNILDHFNQVFINTLLWIMIFNFLFSLYDYDNSRIVKRSFDRSDMNKNTYQMHLCVWGIDVFC